MKMKPKKNLLLATGNPMKLLELERLVAGLPLGLLTPEQISLSLELDEKGLSHMENAQSKAIAFSSASGLLALSSDGGLVVPALGESWKSVLTHRFAGDINDTEKAQTLLRMMEGYKGEQRQVFWREALCLADEAEVVFSYEIEGSSGMLLQELDPSLMVPGFWVSGLWHFPYLNKTYGELLEEERDEINDHWAQLKKLTQSFFNRYLASNCPT
jgi:inosine/xanthosine triphosphate pyrophosphatase family protein